MHHQAYSTRSYVGFSTAHGTELLSISCVTAHMYRFSFAISDFLSEGSFTRVNFTSIRSFAFSGLLETGQYTLLSGFSIREIFAAGDWEGTQKLGSSLRLPRDTFEIAPLVLGCSAALTR
uniref:Uncharacterized protein n=1 Tax=Anopheles atroparvus TaxID=41427 RepID=A0A182IUJ5_ANOAO